MTTSRWPLVGKEEGFAGVLFGPFGAGGPGERLTPEHIRDVVARRWHVKPEALATKRRTRDVAVPRQVAMHLIKSLLDMPLVKIGEVFGGRDHSTVIHSIRKVGALLEEDAEFRAEVEAARAELMGRR